MEKKQKLKESSKKLAYTSGALHGLAGIPKGKVGLGIKLAGSATSIGSTVQNVRGSKGVGDFLKTEVGNMFRTAIGFGGALAATHGASKGLKKVRSSGVAKKAGQAVRSKLGKNSKMKDVSPKKGKFIRINGRVVPIKTK